MKESCSTILLEKTEKLLQRKRNIHGYAFLVRDIYDIRIEKELINKALYKVPIYAAENQQFGINLHTFVKPDDWKMQVLGTYDSRKIRRERIKALIDMEAYGNKSSGKANLFMDVVDSSLEQLPESYQEVLRLIYGLNTFADPLSRRQIGRRIEGKPRNGRAVTKILSRARNKLREDNLATPILDKLRYVFA